MSRQQDQHSSLEQGSNSESARVTGRPGMDWEQPDFEEFNLCMEVTAYINHWQ